MCSTKRIRRLPTLFAPAQNSIPYDLNNRMNPLRLNNSNRSRSRNRNRRRNRMASSKRFGTNRLLVSSPRELLTNRSIAIHFPPPLFPCPRNRQADQRKIPPLLPRVRGRALHDAL